jgi:subtilisin family serine protease
MLRGALATTSAALLLGGAAGAGGGASSLLVQLRLGAPASAAAALSAAGAAPIAPGIRLWRVRAGTGSAELRRLRAARAVSFVEPERTYSVDAVTADVDPLEPSEWWRRAVRVDALTPPGPGVPITIVDSGVSFGHQEFSGRPNLLALNDQEPAPLGGVHGTAVASVAGAPLNGVGLAGVYPAALIRSYDASLGDGTRLPAGEIAAGIVAAARTGRSVINLSLGSDRPDRAIEAALGEAVRTGSLVVAASGNSGDEGNWLGYPGASPHVLTVAATDASDAVATFSTRSPWVDLAAPGVDIPIASALDGGYSVASGTSFSAPIVAGAAAWIWTVRPELDASQVAEILRRSARDVGAPGFDSATGYGVLDVAAALSTPTPQADRAEPNDGASTATTLTTAGRASATTSGRVAAFDDPRDVLRVWAPAKRKLTATATADAGVNVDLYGGSITAAGRLASPRRSGAGTSLSFTNKGAGRSLYLVVTPARRVRSSAYKLTLAAA